MTVLDLDPPQKSLRLVATNGQTATRDSRYRSGATLYCDARSLYRQVLQASLVCGESIDADALRVVLATKQANMAGSIRCFTAANIWQLMFVDVVAWCRNRRLDVPPDCAHAITSVIGYLDATDGFDAASDSVDALYDAVDECTGGWSDDHPTTRGGVRRSLQSRRGSKRS
jgi:hypothetical protein